MTEEERALQSWFGSRLTIQSLYERQGKRLVFSAEAEEGECRVFLSKNHDIREKLWRGIIPRREKISNRYLAPLIDSGRLPSGDYYWCFSLGKTFSSLEQSFAQWPQNALHLIRLVQQTAQGVAALHRKSVVHGDIRPRNIGVQISSLGAEEVLVFGSIMVFLPKEGHWPENVLKDQALTQAPEIVSGEKIPTYASDVYSLGVLLFRSVFGRWPFDAGSSFEISAKHVTEALGCPKVKPSIAPELWDIIEGAMNKDPEERISCREFADRIAPFANYEKAIFGDIELTDPSLIERPSPLQSSSILPLSEEPIIDEEEEMFWELEEQDFEVLSFLDEKEESVAEEEILTDPQVEEVEFLEQLEQRLESEQESSVSESPVAEEEIDVQEDRTEKMTAMPIVIPEHDPEAEPLQILVGARPMPSSSHLEEEVTARIDPTSKLPVFWENTQEVAATEEPATPDLDHTDKSDQPLLFDSTVEVLVEHEDTTKHGMIISPKQSKPSSVIAKEITDKKIALRKETKVKKGAELSKVHFAIFMMLSTIITVLILKIVEKIF